MDEQQENVGANPRRLEEETSKYLLQIVDQLENVITNLINFNGILIFVIRFWISSVELTLKKIKKSWLKTSY